MVGSIIFFSISLFRGLAYVHKNDIVHLDIKPFTLVFSNADEDSDLKITDFVFAKRLTNECQPHLLSKYHFLIYESAKIQQTKIAGTKIQLSLLITK